MRPARWAVFLSGRGSNAEALLEHLAELDVRLCVSSKAKAFGVLRAKRQGIPVLVLGKEIDWNSLTVQLKRRGVNRIFLLGFMKILPASFVEEWAHRIWNLHPSLLPDFPGTGAIEKSYEANGPMGVSVHEVTTRMDEGPLKLRFQIAEKAQKTMTLEEARLWISITEQRLVRSWARMGSQEWI